MCIHNLIPYCVLHDKPPHQKNQQKIPYPEPVECVEGPTRRAVWRACRSQNARMKLFQEQRQVQPTKTEAHASVTEAKGPHRRLRRAGPWLPALSLSK